MKWNVLCVFILSKGIVIVLQQVVADVCRVCRYVVSQPTLVILSLHIIQAKIFILLEGSLIVLDGHVRVRVGSIYVLDIAVRGE